MRRAVTLSETEWLFLGAPAVVSVEEVHALVEENLEAEPLCYSVESIRGLGNEVGNDLTVEIVEECPDGQQSDAQLVRDDSGELDLIEDDGDDD